MKPIFIYFIVFISFLTLTKPFTLLSDFVTEDGIKVQLLKSKSKKPIPSKSFNTISEQESGFKEYSISVSEPIEKIVLNGYFDDYHEDLLYKLTVFNQETNGILLFKDTLSFGMSKRFMYSLGNTEYKGKEEGTTYSLPLSPWIDSKGKYLILIERKNMFREGENRIMSIRYEIQ